MKSSWLAVGAVAACAGGALALLALGPATPPAPRGSTRGARSVAPAVRAATPTTDPAPSPLGPRALAGVYRASYAHRLTLGEQELLAVSAAGRLDVTSRAGTLRQRYRFTARAVTPEDAPALPAELSFAATRAADGGPSLALPAGDVQARNYARALFDAAAVRLPAREGTCAVTTPSARGEAEVEATPHGLRRTRRLRESLDGAPLTGAGTLELRFSDGALRELVSRETQCVPCPQGELVATTELRWTRIAGTPEPGQAPLTPGELPYEVAPAVAAPAPPARDLGALLQDLERAARVGPARAVLAVFDALSLRLAAVPAEADQALAAIRHGGLTLASQRTLVDALATSATPEAQRALLALLDDGRPELEPNVYLGLGDQRAPLQASVARLSADLAAPGARGLLATGAAGILLARASAPPPALRQALLAQLERDADPEAVIDALAQSGDAALLDLLAERGRSPNPRLRAQAAEALRLVPGPEAEARLLGLLQDASLGVRAAALDACALRPASPRALSAVAPALGDPELHPLAHAALRAWTHDPRSVAQREAVAAALAAAPACDCAPLTESLDRPSGDRP